ncbi:MAG: class I SAM-dependent RNA methyltransferase [Anaerolineales bacterium]|nr:class I SAM-dependent RNA methyltransferase [Anaerolineales bacterium]
MSSSPVIEVTLTTQAYGGDALGRLPDGRAVFVPFGLTGDRVRLRVVAEKSRFARGEMVEILDPAPGRIAPRCPHFTDCGGCHYQHMTYSDQLAAKTAILASQLERIARLKGIPIQPAIASPQEWNYRNHVQFQLTPDGQLGYYKADGRGVLPIRECHLPEAHINNLWPRLDLEPLPGLERVAIRQGREENLLIVLESQDSQPPELAVEGLPVSVVHASPGGSLVMAGSGYILSDVLGRSFYVSAASFFQVNTAMAEAMVAHVLANLPLQNHPVIIDAYCGVGLFSAFLAPHARRLVGIEASASASADFAVNLDEFDNVELYEAPVEQVLPHLEAPADIILVDPPRSGLGRGVLEALLTLQPATLVYVSCDAATLARDLKQLSQGGYHLVQITPFDLFPQTYHIESISFWERLA